MTNKVIEISAIVPTHACVFVAGDEFRLSGEVWTVLAQNAPPATGMVSLKVRASAGYETDLAFYAGHMLDKLVVEGIL